MMIKKSLAGIGGRVKKNEVEQRSNVKRNNILYSSYVVFAHVI